MKKVVLKDLAVILNTSPSQVSRALNQKPDVAPEMRKAALELARQMNYRNFALPSRKIIAVITPYFSDFYNSLLNVLVEQCEERDWLMVIIPYQNIDLLRQDIFAGVIMLSGQANTMQWSKHYKIPLVVINNFGSEEDHICSVFPDADGEIRVALRHFIELGHKKIARIRGYGINSTVQELQRGLPTFERLLAENHLEGVNYNEKTLEDKINRVIELINAGFTAFLVVISDEISVLLRSVSDCGKKVPDDISIIAYEAKAISAFQSPPMTTLEFDYPRLVAVALEQLSNTMDGKEVASQLIIPVKMNIRQSTASPKN